MMATYKDFDIHVEKEQRKSGQFLNYRIVRQSDGWELTKGFSYTEESEEDMVIGLEEVVDDYLQNPEGYE